ncbi:MAG: TIM barrel protein [Luteitalea sp.]|nr:TIM barrel protein [Luteitalea sp.]
MTDALNRRRFGKALVMGLAAASQIVARAAPRRLEAGHTGITWGFQPADAEQAIKDVAQLGFQAFESFGNVLEAWEAKGGLDKVLEAALLPLHSAYCPVDLTDTTKRKEEIAKMVRWGRLIKKCGGSVAVIGPNGVERETYDFNAHRAHIVEALNEIAKALDDIGVVGVLHQHTDTCVETREETYAVMEAVDTRYVKFGPDVGQLQKGGSDPVKVVKDFLPVVRHVHLKDYDGGEHYLGYCPLGQGQVDLTAIVDALDGSGNDLVIMAELDPSKNMTLAPFEAATINRAYLEKLGYSFRS